MQRHKKKPSSSGRPSSPPPRLERALSFESIGSDDEEEDTSPTDPFGLEQQAVATLPGGYNGGSLPLMLMEDDDVVEVKLRAEALPNIWSPLARPKKSTALRSSLGINPLLHALSPRVRAERPKKRATRADVDPAQHDRSLGTNRWCRIHDVPGAPYEWCLVFQEGGINDMTKSRKTLARHFNAAGLHTMSCRNAATRCAAVAPRLSTHITAPTGERNRR